MKEFLTKVKNLCPPRTRRPRSNWATRVQTDTEEEDLEEDLDWEDTDDCCDSPVKTGEEDTPEKVTSQDSFVIKTWKAVQEIMRNKVHAITEPLLDEVKGSKYKLPQSESSFEIEAVVDDLVHALIEEAESLQHSDSESKKRK